MLNVLYLNETDRRIPISCFPRFHASTDCICAILQCRPLVLYHNELSPALAESSSRKKMWLVCVGWMVVGSAREGSNPVRWKPNLPLHPSALGLCNFLCMIPQMELFCFFFVKRLGTSAASYLLFSNQKRPRHRSLAQWTRCVSLIPPPQAGLVKQMITRRFDDNRATRPRSNYTFWRGSSRFIEGFHAYTTAVER